MTSLFDIALPYQKRVITDPSNVKVLNFARQIGKSWCCGFLSTYTCCKKPNSLVLYLSTGLRAANEALKTCLKFAEVVNVLSNGKITYTANSTCITFSNGSRIMSLPGKPESCRGWSADLICLDEVAFWQNPDETWRAIVPTITNQLRGSDKKVVICSTPMGKNSLFYELCQRSKNEKGWNYFQTTIYDAQKEGLKVDIDSLKKMMPDPYAWATEFECQFADSASQLVSISDLEFVNYSTDRKFIEYFIGADWARNSDGTSIAVLGREANGKLTLVELVNLHRVEYAKQIEVAKNIFRKYHPKLFYGDATGLGGPLMEQLNRECSTLIKPFTFNHNNKNSAYEYFRRCVFDRKVQFNEEYRNDIVEDLLLVQQTITDDGKVIYSARRSNNSHADNISAIILALQAERECRQCSTQMTTVGFQSVFGSPSSYFG